MIFVIRVFVAGYFRYWDELVKIYENEDDCMKLNLGEFFIKLVGNSMKTILSEHAQMFLMI